MAPFAHMIRALAPRLFAAAAAAGAGLTLLACGGSSSPAGTGTGTGTGAPARAAAAERSAEQTSEVKFQDFAKCLREHGIQAEADGHGLKVNGGSEAAMKSAEAACARFRPPEQRGPNRMSAQERVAIEEKLQRFAKCMRERGIQVEVSAPGGQPQMNIHASPGGGGPNPESPAFKAAQKTCSKLLPVGPGGGPGGPSPGAGS